MAVAPDHYAVLGISPDADEAVVRAAWRALCRKFHPDTAGDLPDAQEKFRAINDAYAVLNDRNRRIAYNLERSAAPTAESQVQWVESPYPMPPRRTGWATLALILVFVGLPATAVMLPGVPGQVAAMLPHDDTGISGLARASFHQVRRLLTPAGFGAAGPVERPAPGAPLPPIDPRNVQLARVQFGRVVTRHGVAAIPGYAAACAERAASFATWASQDFCVAFDVRADRSIDAAALARYNKLGADPAAAAARVAQIRQLIAQDDR